MFVFLLFIIGSLIYEKLGEKAFGWPGKIGAFVSITMQNIGGKGVSCSLPLKLSKECSVNQETLFFFF